MDGGGCPSESLTLTCVMALWTLEYLELEHCTPDVFFFLFFFFFSHFMRIFCESCWTWKKSREELTRKRGRVNGDLSCLRPRKPNSNVSGEF